jgi:4'-phosphopantetheinyl transferase
VAETRSSILVSIARTGELVGARSSHRILTSDDWESFARLREPAVRGSAIAGRILLRLSLSRAVDRRIAPAEWEFQRTPHGKPVVARNLLDIRFSVSHVDEVAIVAVSSKRNLGIDVETIDQDLHENVIEEFCHSNEKHGLRGLPPHQKTREFVRLWTQKEAYTKLVGLGHSIDFATIDCSSGGAPIAAGGNFVDQTHFESFYLPTDRTLHYTSLAIQQSHLDADVIDLQLSNLVGRDEPGNPSLASNAHQS